MMLDNILNFRDVGVFVNRILGSQVLKEGALFRSATPDNASSRDKTHLEQLHMSTVIDLRSKTEHERASTKALQTSAQPDVKPTHPHLLDLPGVNRLMINLVGWNLQKTLLWRLSWFSMMKCLSYLASGYRDAATAIIAAEAMQPRGLIGLAKDTLVASQVELSILFTHLSRAEAYPVLIHCTQGKDRTGLVVLLLLLLVNGDMSGRIPISAMVDDYNASQKELVVERNERIREMKEYGLTEEFADCAEGFVERVKEFLDSEYGGVRGYLRGAGVSDEVLVKVRESLTA